MLIIINFWRGRWRLQGPETATSGYPKDHHADHVYGAYLDERLRQARRALRAG